MGRGADNENSQYTGVSVLQGKSKGDRGQGEVLLGLPKVREKRIYETLCKENDEIN